MTIKEGTVVYVDHTILSLLPQRPADDDPVFEDWYAAKNLWRSFREEKVRLVTHGKETEMDIILWLNGQGCCITDTLRAVEAITEFESWSKVNKSDVQKFRQVLAHFEELELLRLPEENSGYSVKDGIAEALNLKPSEAPIGDGVEQDNGLLRLCLADLGKWYTSERWRDLKRTDYSLNWQILESVLGRQGIEPILQGKGGVRNRRLFGLLNRAVGLAKKSCGILPVPDTHISFVLNMVLQKYSHDQTLRGMSHLLHCIRHHITTYVTQNHSLIEGFGEHRAVLQEYLQLMFLSLDVMSPSTYAKEMKHEYH